MAAVPGVADPAFVRSLDGQARFDARSAIVAELERLELLDGSSRTPTRCRTATAAACRWSRC